MSRTRPPGDQRRHGVYPPNVKAHQHRACLNSLLAAALLACAARTSAAQLPIASLVDSVQALAERGLSANRLAPIDQAIALVERALAQTPTDSVLQHYRGFAWYRKGTVLNAMKRHKEAKAALDTAERALARAGKTLDWPENAALTGAALGQKIAAGGSPLTAMRLGPRANGELDRALASGPRNPRVYLIRGIGALFKPKLFGGGTDKAAAELERALAAFQTDSARAPLPTWGRVEVYQWLGVVRTRQGRVADARAAYMRVLAADSANVLVRDSLLPALPIAR